MIVPSSTAAPAGGLANAALKRVANRPILCHVLDNMRRAGVSEVSLVLAEPEFAAVRACVEIDGPPGVEVSYFPYGQRGALEQAPRDGTLDQALVEAAASVGDDACFVHVAEGLLDQPLTPLLAGAGEVAPDLVVFLSRRADDGGSIGLATRRLMHLAEIESLDAPLDLTGAALFGAGALRRAAGTSWWSSGRLDLVAVAEQLTAGGGRLGVERVRGWRRYSGDVAGLLELNRIALDALALEPQDVPGPDNHVEGGVEVHPRATVESSTIVGPAIVGPNALVLDSYIGPYTSIGADVQIVGAEVERSIILPGARITHIGGRLVGSVVGRDARIFRDFSLPRALRLNVGDGGEVALC